jgi:hypothetical protein
MRDHLRVVLCASERLDPLGRPQVLQRPVRPRDLPVGDVADEDVPERVLRLAFDGAATGPLHELLLAQDMQLLFRRAERAQPEDFPDDGRVLQQRLLLGRERIESRRDDSLHIFRQRALATLCEHAHELLRVERIAAAALEQVALRFGAEHRHQLRRLLVRQRRELDRRRIHLAAAPSRPPLEQLQPRRANDQERDVAHPVREVVDEVEQPVVGPVDVLEHEHEGVILGERLPELAPGGESLFLRACRATCLPDQGTQV